MNRKTPIHAEPGQTDKRTEQAAQRRYAELEAKLAKKDTVIAQIMEDLIAEKNGGGGR